MSDTAIIQDPRRRNLLWLAIAAAVLVVLAVLALWHQSAEVAPQYHRHPMFPNLAHEARKVARIHVVSKSGTVDVAFLPMKGWVITSRNDFPASFEQVNKTVIGIASLEAVEPKTARADWLHYLDLDAPPKGNGILFTLSDDKGHVLASIITGKSADAGEQGASGLFVRKPDSTQSWLAKTVLEPKSDVSDWYEKSLLNVDRSRIQEADVRPPGGPGYTVRRDKPSDASLKLVNLPSGRQLSYEGAAEGPAAAIVSLSFDDVKPAKNFDFSNAWQDVTHTFDGLTITVDVIQKGQDYWATIYAEGAPGKPAAGKEARAVDARTSGWAYKLPPYKGQQFMTKLDSLLKPLNAPKAQAPNAASPDNDTSDQ
ncbi:MAG TPA: DUF4340 domain-containing protein [Rhizomicrobium sp.]